MSFNDYKILTDQDYSILKTNYEKAYSSEVNDLQEIIDKMQEQKNSLVSNNQNGRYNQVIEKISSNIFELQGLIKSCVNNSNYRSYHQDPNMAGISNNYKNYTQTQQLDEPNGAIHPVRSIEEMRQHNEIVSNPNTTPQTPINTTPNETIEPSPFGDNLNPSTNTPNRNIYRGESGNNIPIENINTTPNFTPNNETPHSPSPANPNGTNTTMRNRPIQMGFITNFIKSLKVGFNSHITRKKALYSHIDYTQTMHRNKYHNISNIVAQNTHPNCDPHRKIATNQIDIIRLLLLYLTLRPTCRYCSRIASITNEQFDILLSLEENS